MHPPPLVRGGQRPGVRQPDRGRCGSVVVVAMADDQLLLIGHSRVAVPGRSYMHCQVLFWVVLQHRDGFKTIA